MQKGLFQVDRGAYPRMPSAGVCERLTCDVAYLGFIFVGAGNYAVAILPSAGLNGSAPCERARPKYDLCSCIPEMVPSRVPANIKTDLGTHFAKVCLDDFGSARAWDDSAWPIRLRFASDIDFGRFARSIGPKVQTLSVAK